MAVAALILVEPAAPGNLGAALRIAANFGVPRVDLVRPGVAPDDPEVLSWACRAQSHLEIACHDTLDVAAAPFTSLVGTASGRGRDALPLIAPHEAARLVAARGAQRAALVFGNETRGLARADLDRCDLVVRIPTQPEFPVLNLTQSIAILLGVMSLEITGPVPGLPEPAPEAELAALMSHLRQSLLAIGFLDAANPERILRKLRRLLGRAGATSKEIAILHGICRQMEWARSAPPPPPDEEGRN